MDRIPPGAGWVYSIDYTHTLPPWGGVRTQFFRVWRRFFGGLGGCPGCPGVAPRTPRKPPETPENLPRPEKLGFRAPHPSLYQRQIFDEKRQKEDSG